MSTDPHELRAVAQHIRQHDEPCLESVPGLLDAAAETIERLARKVEEQGGDVEAILGGST